MVRIINIDTKTRTIRVSNGKDDLEWFTTDTGSHVPLKKGQSKAEAIKEHFGDKKTDRPQTLKGVKQKVKGLTSEIEKLKGQPRAKTKLDKLGREVEKTWRDWEKTKSEQMKESMKAWHDSVKAKQPAKQEQFGDKKSDTKRVAAKIYSKLADRVGYVSDSDLEKYLDDNEYFNDDVREEIVKTVKQLESQASERHTEKDAPKPTKQWQQPRPRDKYTGDEFKQQPAKKETKSEDPRKANDGTNEKFHSMFEKFVPDSGPAETLFGEMIRAAARIRYRYYNDGDMYGYGYGKETVNNALSYLSKLAGGRDTEFKKELDRALYQATTAAAHYDEDEYKRQVDRIVDAFANANWDDIKELASIKNVTDSLTEYPDDTSYDDDDEDEEW